MYLYRTYRGTEQLSSRFNLCFLDISRICRTKLKKSVTFLFVYIYLYTSKQFTRLNIQIFTHFLKGPHDPKLHAILQQLQNQHCRDGISISADGCQCLPLVITIIAELKMLIVINILSSAIIVKPCTHDQVSLDKLYLLVCTA